MTFHIDQIDRTLIGLLMENGRYTNRYMSEVLGVSRTTVHKRIKRMITDKLKIIGEFEKNIKTTAQITEIMKIEIISVKKTPPLSILDRDFCFSFKNRVKTK